MRSQSRAGAGRSRVVTRIGLVLVAAGPMLAHASDENAGDALEEIVVTATKRAESLQDVPVAVSAISAADIQARGLSQYADYLNSVPGVYFEDAGPGVSQIRIRGVVASEGLGPSTVATYFGETVTSVLTLLGGKPNLRLVDIDRVEVLRGPQGTLFGANSLSGVVRIVPAAPDLQTFGVDVATRGFATAHSDQGSYHVEGVLNMPLVQDRLALRLVAYKDDIAGYIDNIVPARGPTDYSFLLDAFAGQPPGTTPAGTLISPGNPAFTRKDINSESTWGGRAALSWRATDELRFDLTLASQSVQLASEPQAAPAAGEYAQQRSLDAFSPGRYSEKLDIGTLVVNYDWSAASLTSASSFTKMQTAHREDIGYLAAQAFGVPLPWENRVNSDGEVFTQEVRLQSRGESPWQWLAGLFYLDQKADLAQRVVDYSCPRCLPTVLFGQDFAYDHPRSNYTTQKQRSLFGELSYKFARKWTLGAGGRYLEEKIEAPSPAQEGLLVGGFSPASDTRKGSSYELNPSAYLRFEPTRDLTVYLQAARGFRSGVTNSPLAYTGTCADEAAAIGLGAVVKPDTLWSYELGTKARIADGRIEINTAIYKQKWHGVQLDATLGGDCALDGTVNAGDVDGEGAELEVTARLTRALRMNFSTAYSHNEFASVKPGVGYAVGERVPGAAETNASAGLQYDFPLNSTWSGFGRGDYAYVGGARYKFDPFDPVIVNQKAYGTANVRLGVQRANLAVELFCRNVADKRAVVSTGNPRAGGYQYLLRPRESGVEVRYSFH
ncbi:MAG: TonB-dependent receptor [Proteobacteria bacterium]|nr:TonB-dependent receptor [Pseudomonadota bacterium]